MFETIMYADLIKICNEYNIEYKTYYGKNQTFKRLKRKVEQYEAKLKKRKADKIYVSPLELDELGTLIKYRYCIGYSDFF